MQYRMTVIKRHAKTKRAKDQGGGDITKDVLSAEERKQRWSTPQEASLAARELQGRLEAKRVAIPRQVRR